MAGVIGGLVASRHGLRAWLWPMLFAIHLPDGVFIHMAYAQPENVTVVQAFVVWEQFGYGFGFTACLLYMMHVARGEHQTANRRPPAPCRLTPSNESRPPRGVAAIV